MVPFIPIVVGITGKRELKGRDEHLGKRLDELFLDLERRFANSPLVLATGLAKGADLLAAEVALKRPENRWTVVGVLPFEHSLFLEDFSADDLGWRQRLQRVVETPTPRFILKVLKPLLSPSGKPFEDKQLHRTDDNAIRRWHYEQVGLFIADRCGLLVAVMPIHEEPGKIGGTARIARYKRDGKFDEESARVAHDSQEIALPEPLDCEMKGLVRIIDLDHIELLGGSVGIKEYGDRYAWMTLERIEAFNAIARGSLTGPADAQVPAAENLFDTTKEDATSNYVTRLRQELSNIQGRAKGRLSWSIWALVSLFVSSVAILETSAKLAPDLHWLFAGYAVILLSGLVLFYLVRKGALQAIAEDYRGAAEAMRVQVEWWRLGLRGPKHRVDRYYLVGGEGHFAVLRSGIKAVLDAAVLLGPHPALPAQPFELDPEKKGLSRRDFWIPSQIDFFEKRSDSKHRTAIRLSSLAWYLLQLSVGLGVAIGGLMLLREQIVFAPALTRSLALIKEHQRWLPAFTFVLAVLWPVLFLVWVRTPEQEPLPAGSTLWHRVRHMVWHRRLLGTRGQHSGKHGWSIGLLLGILMVPSVLAYAITQEPHAEALYKTHKLSLVLMILLAAASGAIRFVLERLALEAEAVSYRETLQRFKAARLRALEVRRKAGSGDHREMMTLKADQALGYALGRVALAENEAWLRAHRQRPFEPLS